MHKFVPNCPLQPLRHWRKKISKPLKGFFFGFLLGIPLKVVKIPHKETFFSLTDHLTIKAWSTKRRESFLLNKLRNILILSLVLLKVFEKTSKFYKSSSLSLFRELIDKQSTQSRKPESAQPEIRTLACKENFELCYFCFKLWSNFNGNSIKCLTKE